MEMVIKFYNWILEFALWGILMNSFTLWSAVHPLVLCLLLISYSVLTIAIVGFLVSKWVSYAVVLIFLGGMMIIFIYVTTLAGSEKFFIHSNIPLPYTVLPLFLLYPVSVNYETNSKELMMAHIYQLESPILWVAILFLLASLFLVVKQAESFKGALIKYS